MLTTTIENHSEMQVALEDNNLKPAASLQALCLSLFQAGITLDEPTVIIKIAQDVMPISYITNPCMFARTLLKKTAYANVQAYLRGSYICVRAGRTSTAITFRARVRKGLLIQREFTAIRKKIPPSYRRRPSLLSAALTKEIGVKVCNHCKKDTICWFVPETN